MASSSDDSIWIGDGSEGGKLDVAVTDGGGAAIALASSTRETPFNVRLDAGPADNSYYEVKVTDLAEGSSLGAGLVAAGGFRPGWHTSGCFYNGNVAKGTAGLITGFGPPIGTGDVVGVRERRRTRDGDDGGGRDVIFYHNGRCLGAGFALECGEDMILYPCLRVHGSAAVEYSIPSPPPSLEREEEVRNPGDPYGGDWAIERASSGPERSEIYAIKGGDPALTIRFEGDGARYSVFAKISNRLSTSLTITGKAGGFDEIQMGTCSATTKMPPADLVEVEGLVESALNSNGDAYFREMTVTDEGKLLMAGPTVEVICSRHMETFEPVRCSCSGGKVAWYGSTW